MISRYTTMNGYYFEWIRGYGEWIHLSAESECTQLLWYFCVGLDPRQASEMTHLLPLSFFTCCFKAFSMYVGQRWSSYKYHPPFPHLQTPCSTGTVVTGPIKVGLFTIPAPPLLSIQIGIISLGLLYINFSPDPSV
jgi:hypothetical protein